MLFQRPLRVHQIGVPASDLPLELTFVKVGCLIHQLYDRVVGLVVLKLGQEIRQLLCLRIYDIFLSFQLIYRLKRAIDKVQNRRRFLLSYR